MTLEPDDAPLALGVVVETGRGSLPFTLLHGESLVACAAWSLGEAGVQLVDLTTPWDDVAEAGLPLVLHDSLCPLTPPDFVATCVRRSLADDVVVAGVRVVTDTVKQVVDTPEGPVVGDTLDRDRLAHLASPIVVPAPLLGALPGWPPDDFRDVLAVLRQQAEVVLVDAPPSGRRVASADDVRALESTTPR